MTHQIAPIANVLRRPGRRCALLAGMLASVLIAAGCSTGNDFGAQPRFTADGGIETGVDPLSRGKRHFANGNFGLAVEAFEEARQIAPSSANVLNALAVAYEEIGRPDLADSYFMEALDSEPDSAQTYNNWAMAQLSRGNAVKAQELLAEAARLSPDDDVVIANIARVAMATAVPTADQAVVAPLATGSLIAVIAELQQSGGWAPSIQAVAPHVHVLRTLPPGSAAPAATDGALPIVFYPQTAAAGILPLPDETEMPTPPPAVPVIPVFAAMLDMPDANAAVRPMLAGRLTSAVPVGSRYPDDGEPRNAQTLLAQASTDVSKESPHFYARDELLNGSDGIERADPVLVKPFQGIPQDVELAAMSFLPIGPEPDDADSGAVGVLMAARMIELEPAVASRPEPMAIGVWSTPPSAASETMPEPPEVSPASAVAPAATGTIVVPYEGQTIDSGEADEAAHVAVPYGTQTAVVPFDPIDQTQPIAPPAAKPEGLGAEAALPLDSAIGTRSDIRSGSEALVPQPYDVGAAAGPGVTALAAVPPLLSIADAVRAAVSPLPASDTRSIHPDASARMPLVIAVLAASEAMAPHSSSADTHSHQPSRSPLAAAGRIPTVVATIAMRKMDETHDGHANDLESAR